MKFARSVAIILALGAAGFCQDDLDPQVFWHRRQAGENPASSLAHFRLAQMYAQRRNFMQAANECREALNGDLEPKWTEVWAHIMLARIFDFNGQHDRAMNEYRQAQRTGDNTWGAQDEVTRAGIAPPVDPGNWDVLEGEAAPIQATEPEYSDEARLAQLEGTVLLVGSIGEDGLAHDLLVEESLGLGLDEKALEAVEQWRFAPVLNQGSSYEKFFRIPVSFHLPAKQSRWHLIRARFDAPPGTSRPVFVSAPYPIGAGLSPIAMEEGRLVAAMGRLATVSVRFEIDEHGVPGHLQVLSSSADVWGGEATALVGEWRFTPGMRNGIAVPVVSSVDLVWGEKELTASSLRALHP
ncbi:MAG TPA: TonB family protein [Bryobacteraceae bacterium]|nr:TonB family protein [Bryobacteraceae bacterium]